MKKSLLVRVFLATCLFVLLGLDEVGAKEVVLTGIEVTNEDHHLLLYSRVEGGFAAEMADEVAKGTPVTFSFYVRVRKIKTFWWDQRIASVKIRLLVEYDPKKEVYVLSSTEEGKQNTTVSDAAKLNRILFEIKGLKVAKLQDLKTGEKYQISMMAEIRRKGLFFRLRDIFSKRDYKTEWYSVDFTY